VYERNCYKQRSPSLNKPLGFTPQRHILYALSLNKLVILEGWKAQSLSAQNQSMVAGVFGRDF